jgi:hypothetical protein
MTQVSAEYLPMLGCHGGHQCLLQTLHNAQTWFSLCFHANATGRLNASFKRESAMACGHRNSCHCTTQHLSVAVEVHNRKETTWSLNMVAFGNNYKKS